MMNCTHGLQNEGPNGLLTGPGRGPHSCRAAFAALSKEREKHGALPATTCLWPKRARGLKDKEKDAAKALPAWLWPLTAGQGAKSNPDE